MYGQQPSPHAYPASPPTYQMKRQCSYTHSTPTPIHPPVDGMSRSASYFPSSEHRPYSPPTPPMDMSSQQKVSLPPISHLMSLVGSSTSHQQRPRVEIPKFHTVPAEYHATPKEVLPPTPPMSYNGIGSALAHQSSGSRLSPLPSEHSRPLVREQRLSMASESSVYSAVSNRSRSPASVSTPASALSSAYSDSYHRPSAYQPQSVLGKRPTPADFHPARDLPVPMQHPRSPESTPASASTSPVSTHKHLDNETHSISTGASSPNSQFVPSERYLCQQCNKAFSRPSSLRIHSHSHTGEKPYKCPHKSCGKAFSVRSNMKRHEKGCHAEERDRLMEMMGNSRPAERELLPAAAA